MKHYFLFDSIIEHNKTMPIITSAKALIELLKINAIPFTDAKSDNGTEKMGIDKFKFFLRHAYNISLASHAQKDILCVENSSFTSLSITKEALLADEKLRNEIAEHLQKDNIVLSLDANICKLEEAIKEKIGFATLEAIIKNPFDKFYAALFFGTSFCKAKKFTDISLTQELLDLVLTKSVNYPSAYESDGYEVLAASAPLAYKLASKTMLDIFDNGADFVVVNDARSFVMFDTHHKDAVKSAQRDIELSVFTLPQILLLALGITDKQKLGFDKHKAPITII